MKPLLKTLPDLVFTTEGSERLRLDIKSSPFASFLFVITDESLDTRPTGVSLCAARKLVEASSIDGGEMADVSVGSRRTLDMFSFD